jgi:PAS domain S-box-containing protein
MGAFMGTSSTLSEQSNTILVVDDDAFARKALCFSLESEGYRVHTATNGAEAVDQAKALKPDLILMDVVIPKISGIEATKALMDHQETRYIPVILVTVIDKKEDIIDGLVAGATDYITKPFFLPEIKARVKAILRLKRLHDESIETRRQLNKSEENYRLLVENQTDLVVKLDVTGRFVFVSPTYCEMFQKNQEELLGEEFLPLVREHDQEVTEKAMEDLYRPPYSCHVEQRAFTNGRWRWLEWVFKAVLDEESNVLATVGVGREITKQKEILEVLWENHRTITNLLSNLPGMVYRCFYHREWIMEFVNDGCIPLTGYTPADLIHNRKIPYAELIHPEDRERVLNEMHLAVGRNIPFSLTYRIITAMGENKVVWDQGRGVLSPEGSLLTLEGFITDITDRIQAEKERQLFEDQFVEAQKFEAIGTMSGGIAHDFGNLLQTILGYSELLLKSKDSEHPGYLELERIVTAVRRGGELTRRLLTYLRKAETKKRPLNLNKEITQVTNILERTIPKMIEMEVHLAQDLKIINADSIQMEQVLMNLALNARDAMPEGGKLLLETENVAVDENLSPWHSNGNPVDYVLLSVSDTGHGMDKDTLEHIFEPFYTTKEAGKGTGLGLATVYGIVKSHNGHVICYSELGVGTTFKVYLPVDEQDAALLEQESAEPAQVGGNETILLVEDEPYIRELGEDLLSEFGYTVLTAEDGENALSIYDQQGDQIDLIILDVIMPGMGGRRCFEELRKINPEVKVVIASGFSSSVPEVEAIEEGAIGFISKPFDIRQMLQEVRKAIDHTDA